MSKQKSINYSSRARTNRHAWSSTSTSGSRHSQDMLTARQQRNGDGDGHKRKCANGLNGTKNSLVNNPQTWQPRLQYIPTYEYIETKVGLGGWGRQLSLEAAVNMCFYYRKHSCSRRPRTEDRGRRSEDRQNCSHVHSSKWNS